MPKPSVFLKVSGAFAPRLIATQDLMVKKPDGLSFAEAVSAQQSMAPTVWRNGGRPSAKTTAETKIDIAQTQSATAALYRTMLTAQTKKTASRRTGQSHQGELPRGHQWGHRKAPPERPTKADNMAAAYKACASSLTNPPYSQQ